MKAQMKYFVALGLLVLFSQNLLSNFEDDLWDADFEEIAKIKVKSASGVKEDYLSSPGTMVVVTQQDIRDRAYTDFAEIVRDLPGFDVVELNGVVYITAYQRGYRTPFTQRTLLMMDGKPMNHLWTHHAMMSRQISLNNIERVEVLYGPASAVYGPNAFLGVINIITNKAEDLEEDSSISNATVSYGDFNTVNLDVSTRGKSKNIYYSLSGKVFRSDEADLSWYGHNTNDKYSNRGTWGPLLDHEYNGESVGRYSDPTDDFGFDFMLGFKDTKIGLTHWDINEGFGANYPADKAQNLTFWRRKSTNLYVEHLSRFSENISLDHILMYKNHFWGGDWMEAVPDAADTINNSSFISSTNWRSISDAIFYRSNLNYTINDQLSLQSGIKWERKNLTKSYDVPGYWGNFSSINFPDNGPHGQGGAIGRSTDSLYIFPPAPTDDMPTRNMILTNDLGAFTQLKYNNNNLSITAGIRVDDNSIFGTFISPRFATVYKTGEHSAIKFLYGHAFQEPAPVQLFGAWSGREANSLLKPETVDNFELNGMFKTGVLSHEISAYYAHYEDVILVEAKNNDESNIIGIEYKLRFQFDNFLPSDRKISGYLYYTFNDVLFNMVTSQTINDTTIVTSTKQIDLGDISPHKINFGLNIPIYKGLKIFLSGNYVHQKELYLTNALRGIEKLDSYFVLNGNVSYNFENVSFSLKALNILDSEIFHSGTEYANAGTNFDQSSLGFYNSKIPQPGRRFLLSMNIDI